MRDAKKSKTCIANQEKEKATARLKMQHVDPFMPNRANNAKLQQISAATMTCVPYPVFVHQEPVDAENGRSALAAVGKCRIYPESCLKNAQLLFRAIVDKNVQQALETNDKQLRKKYMKQGVAMAKSLLTETLKLDVSIVDVEVVLNAEDVIKSDGCLAACLLDSGCHAIVVDGVNVNAMDAAKIPRTRLVAHFSSSMPTLEQVDAASLLASTISVEYHGDNKASADDLQALLMLGEKSKDTSTVVQVRSEDCDASNAVELSSMIGELDGPVALVDPTPTQLGLCYAARMKTDRPDGLFTTVVCTRAGEALGLVYSSKVRDEVAMCDAVLLLCCRCLAGPVLIHSDTNLPILFLQKLYSQESIVAALECGRGVYFSRSRKGLWRKGDTSGHYQVLHRLDVDCDGDALRFTVTQRGDDTAAFCHLNTLTCWGEPRGLRHLEQTLNERLKSAPEGSYTKRLFEDEDLLRDKLVEEAQELSEAQEPDDVAGELADVLYFAMVRAAKAGVSIDEAVAELDRRTRKVTRRKGDSKAFRIVAGNAILNTDTKK